MVMTSYKKVIVKEGEGSLLRRVKCIPEQIFQIIPQSCLRKPQLVIFDYDNTLVDSWPQDFETSNQVFKALGHPPMEVVEMLQQPHTPAVMAIMERTGLPYEQVKTTYNSIYRAVHEAIAPPVPGASMLLDLLKEMGILTAVISNKEEDLLHTTLKTIGWENYFESIYGAAPHKPHKPNPDVVKEIVEKMPGPIPRENIFFVGDALSSDIICALRARVIPIWMSEYSVDELVFGNVGPFLFPTENCLTLARLLETWL